MRKKQNRVEGLEDEEMALVIRGNDRVELSGFRIRRKGWPWARRSVLTRSCAGQVSLDSMFNILTEGSKQRAFEELGRRLAEEQGKIFEPIAKESVLPIVKTTASHLKSVGEARVKELIGSKDADSEAANKLLREVSKDCLEMFKGGLSAELSGGVRRFVSVAAERFKDQISNCQGTETLTELPILPEGTKFVRRHGNRTVFVIEQRPQVRTLCFNPEFLTSEPEVPRIPSTWLEADEKRGFKVPLAFPYMVFVLTFDKDYFDSCRCYYRTKPLQSLDDELWRSNLPNIQSGIVCLSYEQQLDGSISDIAQDVIAHFWGSMFNQDYQVDYGEAALVDKRVSSLVAWKRASKRSPRFVLSVPWTKNMETLRQIVDHHLNDEGESFDELTSQFTKRFEQELQTAIEQAYEQISTTGRYHKTIRDRLSGSLNRLLATVLGRVGETADEVSKFVPKQLQHELIGTIHRTLSQVAAEKFVELSGQIVMGRSVDAQELIYGVNRRLANQSVDLTRFNRDFYPASRD